jgi:hypothetical protein
MMVYRALFLTPDDELIKEYALPEVRPVLMMAVPTKLTWKHFTEQIDPSDLDMCIKAIRFILQPTESRIYSLLVPDTLVYRQEGWERENRLVNA